jgi:cell shape-determining protein MreD
MTYLVGITLFGILAILQSTIVSRMQLINGTADIILLFVVAWALQDRVKTAWQWCIVGGIFASLYSALPFGTIIFVYLIATGISRILIHRVWKAPFLAMLVATLIGTLIAQLVSLSARLLSGVSIPIITTLNIIFLPGLLLNLILAIPVYSITRDVAGSLHPETLEE